MDRVFAPLATMGLRWRSLDEPGRLPITMIGGALHAAAFNLPCASAQVVSGLLFAGLAAQGRTSVTVPRPVRDHTPRLFRHIGLAVETPTACTVVLPGPQRVPTFSMRLVGDASAAAFVAVAAAIVPGSEVEIRDVGLNPGRIGWVNVLRRMGAEIDVLEQDRWGGEPVGRITVKARALKATDVLPHEVPGVIDELPTLAIAAAVAQGRSRVSGAGELRLKESDRIDSMCAGLRSVGVKATEKRDGYVIEGRPRGVLGGRVEAGGDHRIAMAFSVLGLVAQDAVQIRGLRTVSDSFPGFDEALGQLQS
jgi:3-phosphoshikimate 1-carboxyvinyltransferase